MIKVKDENEIAPEFDKPVYDLYVPEMTEAGTSVGQVLARDPDVEGQQVTYTISSGDTGKHSNNVSSHAYMYRY